MCVLWRRYHGLPLTLVGGFAGLFQLLCGILEPALCLLEVLFKKTDSPCECLDLTFSLLEIKKNTLEYVTLELQNMIRREEPLSIYKTYFSYNVSKWHVCIYVFLITHTVLSIMIFLIN